MASTSLSRTCTGSLPDSARYKFTFSGWFKLSGLTTSAYVFNAYATSSFRAFVAFDTDQLVFKNFNGGTLTVNIGTSALYRDTNAWYHVVVTGDTTQATASDRVKMWVNGELASLSSTTYPSQNSAFELGTGGGSWTHYVGSGAGGDYFNGSMTHVHYVEGTAYDASAFGETDATTGIWKPKTSPSVTYNVNSWFLKFENSGSIGTDSSGQGNNFSVASGSVLQTVDTPSNVFCTLNPLSHAGTGAFSNGNNTLFAAGTVNFRNAIATLGAGKGKYYWELKLVSTSAGAFYCLPGITATQNQIQGTVDSANTLTNIATTQGHSYIFSNNSSDLNYNGGSTSYTKSNFATGDIVQIALDIDNSKLYLGINGTWQNSGDPSSGTGGASIILPDATVGSYTGSGYWSPCVCLYYDAVISFNFGNGYFGTTAVSSAQSPSDGIGIFEYTVPTGYKALCTKSINAQEYS